MRAYWKTILWSCFILYMSIVREYKLPLTLEFSWRDKLFHALAYCVLGVLFGMELHKDEVKGYRYTILLLLLPICFGGIIELLQQYFFAPRVGDWADFAANSIGVLTAWLICGIFVTR